MFHLFGHIEKRLTNTINHLFAFGLFCILIGMLVILDEIMLRIFSGLIFFFVAYIVLYMAYKLQGIRDICERFGGIARIHGCKTCAPKQKKSGRAGSGFAGKK